MLMFPKQSTLQDKKHITWIKTLPCILTGTNEVECCHIREGENAGLGRKPSDEMTVPMHYLLHKAQHAAGSESKFYAAHGYSLKEVKQLARDLYAVSGNTDKALEIIARFR